MATKILLPQQIKFVAIQTTNLFVVATKLFCEGTFVVKTKTFYLQEQNNSFVIQSLLFATVGNLAYL